ncbi:hypothetical protein [Ohtaekwangia koreensis]|uniref:Uncharacterized protein n=1 Tax=Ohtaekwangia koreensis TaxID=688867 RepID=A0A1T5JQ31_9BACT|nr:hypothetical protein [Ohtaekwangia koreensis]SKC53429.1 hypothetical protein SAMN05660236_1342 [Ohtaekwangia koreensis]
MQNYNISKCADLPLSIKRGDTFYLNFIVKYNDEAVDLSSYTIAKMQARENEYSSPVLTYSSSGGTIDISYLNAGQIIINGITDDVPTGQYYYDIELSNDNFIETVVSGKLIIDDDYTR